MPIDFSGIDLEGPVSPEQNSAPDDAVASDGIDFSGINLSGVDFSGLDKPNNDEKSGESDDYAITRGFKAGIDQTQAIAGGFVGLVGDRVGSEGMKKYGLEVYQRNMAEAGENAPETNFLDIDPLAEGGVGRAANWAGYALGNAAPMLAVSLLGGGIGGIAGRAAAKKGAEAFVREQMENGVERAVAEEVAKKAIGAAAAKGSAAGAYTSSAVLSTGSIYGDVEDADVAVAHGLVAAAVDALPVTRILGKMGLGKQATEEITGSVVSEFAKQGALEGGTEFIQSFIEQHAAFWVQQNESLLANLDQVDVNELIEAAAMGGLAGGALGGATSAYNNINRQSGASGSLREDTAFDDMIDPVDAEPSQSGSKDVALYTDPDVIYGEEPDWAKSDRTEKSGVAAKREEANRAAFEGQFPAPDPERIDAEIKRAATERASRYNSFQEKRAIDQGQSLDVDMERDLTADLDAPTVDTVRNQRADERLAMPMYRDRLSDMAKELVDGGGIAYLRDDVTDQINGRTASQNPEWFRSNGDIPSKGYVEKVIKKALNGDKLGTKEQRTLSAMFDAVDDERVRGEQEDTIAQWGSLFDEAKFRASVDPDDPAPIADWMPSVGEFFDDGQLPPDGGELASLAILWDQAESLGASKETLRSIAEQSESSEALARGIYDEIQRNTQAILGRTTRRGGADQAEAGSTAPSVEGQQSSRGLQPPGSAQGFNATQVETEPTPELVANPPKGLAEPTVGSVESTPELAINPPLNSVESTPELIPVKSQKIPGPTPTLNPAPAGDVVIDTSAAALSPENDLPEPTPAQKEAGNYKKAKVRVLGREVTIENPKGSKRSGVDPNGKAWSVDMQNHYGYINRTEGADGDQVDVFVGPNPASESVFVVDQIDADGKFDEHKVMAGFDSEAEAVAAYKSNYDKGWKVGPVTAMSSAEFDGWLKEGDTKAPLSPDVEYSMEYSKKPDQDVVDDKGGVEMPQKAYHGTPHEFEQFSLDKIGAGEGAQAKGWGAYLAGRKRVAEHYQKEVTEGKLSDEIEKTLTQKAEGMDETTARVIRKVMLRKGFDTAPEAIFDEAVDVYGADYDFMEGNKDLTINAIKATQELKRDGNLYEATIPEDSELLDWDMPLGQQPEQVKTALAELKNELPEEFHDMIADGLNADFDELTGQELYRSLARWASEGALPRESEADLADSRPDRNASLTLSRFGIQGSRHMDGSKRKGNPDGGYNYVIWDESQITVDSRNGTPVAPKAKVAEQGADDLYSGNERETSNIQGGERDQGGVSEPSTGKASQISLFDQPKQAATRARAAGQFFTRSVATETRSIPIGIDKVSSPADAAHILAPLRRSSQENMYALVLDANDKPISIIHHTKGKSDAASVYAEELVGAIAATPGAVSVYYSHNHPSGTTRPSDADYRVTERINKALEPTGIASRGHVIVAAGEGEVAFFNRGASDTTTIPVPPRARRNKISVTERTIRKRSKEAAISSAVDAIEVLKAYPQGVALLNTSHRIAGFLPLTAEEMGKMRGNGYRDFMAGMTTANANRVIISVDTATPEQYQNVIKAVNHAEFTVLDVIVNGESRAQKGASFSEKGPFFRRAGIDGKDGPVYTRSGNQAPAKQLNAAMAKYLGPEWSKAFESVTLPDAFSGIGEAIQTAFGRKIRPIAATGKEFDIFDGVYLPSGSGSIYVNVDAQVGFVNIAGHELLHDLKRSRPDLYGWLTEQAGDYLQDFPAYKAKLNKLLQDGETEYNDSTALEELLADFMGDALADPEFVGKLAAANPTKFKALLTSVIQWLKSLSGKLKDLGSSEYISDVNALRADLEAALHAFADGKDVAEVMSGGGFKTSRKKSAVTMTATERNGSLKNVDPAVRKAVLNTLAREDSQEAARIKKNLDELTETAWAVTAIKGLAVREFFHLGMEGKANTPEAQAILDSDIWGGDAGDRMRNKTIIKAFASGDARKVEAVLATYPNVLTDNKKAEKAVSTSMKNCDPSRACAMHCYDATGTGGNPNSIIKSEFLEWGAEKYPDLFADIVESQYRATTLAQSGLALRLNDKGDLSKSQLVLLDKMRERGIRMQIFSKRPELLRQVDPFHLRMLSVDATNLDVATANPDMQLAITLTDELTDADLSPLAARAAVILPVNLKGKDWSISEIKSRYPSSHSKMRDAICPVEAGQVDVMRDVSYVQITDPSIRTPLTKGGKKAWTCASCDKKGTVGCFHGANQTEVARSQLIGSSDPTENQRAAMRNNIRLELDKLKKLGGISDEQYKNILAEITQGSGAGVGNTDAGAAEVAGQGNRKRGRADQRGGAEVQEGTGRTEGDEGLSPPKFSRNQGASPEPAFTPPPEEKFTDRLIRVWQDKFKPLKNLQETIADQRGAIPDSQNAYMAEELFHGKTEEDLNAIEAKLVKPLADYLAAEKIDLKELDLYLIAKHARERNKYIASKREDMQDGGSGMTNEEADAILALAEASGREAVLSEAAAKVYKITNAQRRIFEVGGLMTGEQIAGWRDQYQHYVPLKGYAEGEREATTPRRGRGFDIRGKESMKALGRRSMADSPTLHAIQDITTATVRYRKNQVGQKLLALAEANPNPEYWEVFTNANPDTRMAEVDGEIKETKIYNMGQLKDDYFAVKRDGVEHYIKLKDKRMLTAMQNLGPQQLGWFIKSLGSINRYLSMINTSLNPEFMVSNLARDVQTALFNISAEQDIKGGKVQGKKIAYAVSKGTPLAMRAIYRASFGKEPANAVDREYRQYYREYLRDGAKTGYFDSKDINALEKDVQALIEISQGTTTGKYLKAKRGVASFVDKVNGAVENAVRLSAYIEARKAGETEGGAPISREQAASFAKNLTVNFNRKGEAGVALNSLYMFANASIQGTANFLRAIGTLQESEQGKHLSNLYTGKRLNKAQKAAGVLVGAAYAVAALNRAMSEEDDDGVLFFDKVPGYVRERNFVLMKSAIGMGEGNEYWTIPLPYGYNIFYNLGDTIESAMGSTYQPRRDELLGNLAMSVMSSFNPIGWHQGGIVQTVAPTVLVPGIEHKANENFFGSPVYKENFPLGAQKADAELSFRSTKQIYKDISEWVNDATGGDTYISGYIDVSPDTLEHITEFALGGLYTFATRSYDSASRVIEGREVPTRNIPFVRKVSGEVTPYADQSALYDRVQQVTNLAEQRDELRGMERVNFSRKHRELIRLENDGKRAKKELATLRKRRDAVEAMDNISPKEMDERIDRIEKKMKRVVDRYNKRFNEAQAKAND